jgi:hypothetical protein
MFPSLHLPASVVEALAVRGLGVSTRVLAELRSEFVTFSKVPRIDAANKAVTTTKSSKIQKKSQTLSLDPLDSAQGKLA